MLFPMQLITNKPNPKFTTRQLHIEADEECEKLREKCFMQFGATPGWHNKEHSLESGHNCQA